MAASPRILSGRRCLSAGASRSVLLALFLALEFVIPTASRSQTPPLNQTGRWSGKYTIGVRGTHVAVLRGSTANDTSKVLIFGGSGIGLMFALWSFVPQTGFSPPPDIAVNPPTSFQIPGPGRDVFCSGHSVLSGSGRLLVVGGDHGGVQDANAAFIFDQTPPSATSPRWALQSLMTDMRWYPTVSTMATGNVLSTSGLKYENMISFGGPTNVSGRGLNVLALPVKALWTDPAALLGDPAVRAPSERHGHTLTFDRYYSGEYHEDRHAILFGGKGASGPLGDAWALWRLATDTTWSWQKLVLDSNLVADDPQGPPPARYRHAAVVTASDAIIVYGGLGQNDVPLNDVWKLYWVQQPGTGIYTWHWQFVGVAPSTPSGPGARFGHSTVYFPPESADPARTEHIVVFGGWNSPTVGSDALPGTWALRRQTNPPSAWTWEALTPFGTPPSARGGHSAVWDQSESRALMFGGQFDYQTTGGGLRNDTWQLRRSWNAGPGSYSWTWTQIQTTPSPPTSRVWAAPAYDPDWRRMLVFGGDTVGDLSGLASDTWTLDFSTGGAVWGQPAQTSPRTPPPQAGAALYDRRAVFARYPESFNPSDGPGGRWTRLDSAPRLNDNYSFMFQMPDGRMLDAGPYKGSQLWFLNPGTPSWQSTTTVSNPQNLRGSAVMYAPGKVLRCGLRAGEEKEVPIAGLGWEEADILDLTPSGSGVVGWTRTLNDMLPRKNHDLTVLPTGKVLVTGGVIGEVQNNQVVAKYQRQPQMWDPADNQWHNEVQPGLAPFASDPAQRNYHSAAILLPDARVLSSGGEWPNAIDYENVTIFEPPYLFDASGGYAPRPSVSGAPAQVNYGKVFTICSNQAPTISSACLIRPGAVTHSFNQDQRFVPLAIAKASNPPRLFATTPANGNLAPPGDYLLFLVDSTATGGRNIPSVAKWIKVDPAGGLDLCDITPPSIVTDLSVTCDPNVFNNFFVSWTAPGDDSIFVASGVATQYEMRISSQHITNQNWLQATLVTTPLPVTAGTAQSIQMQGPAQKKYIRMRTKDDLSANGTWAGLSNEAVIEALSPFEDCLGGGGMFAAGGGPPPGSRMQPAAAGVSLQPAEATWLAENTLLNGVAAGTRTGDLLRLPGTLVAGGSAYSFRIREAGGRAARLDAARLLTVDHSAAARSFLSGGRPVLGNRVPPVHVIDGAGVDATSLVDGTTASSFAGDSGAVLTVQLSIDSAATSDPVVIEACGLGSASSGILLQVPDGGGWRTLARSHPRLQFDEIVVDSVAACQVRLQFLGRHQVRFVGRVARLSEQPFLQWAQLVSAQDSRLGDALSTVIRADTASATLAGPDTLMLSFAAPPLAAGQVRECFLAVDATPLSPLGIMASPLRGGAVESTPTRFALWQNQPNPFSASTTIRFDLPVGAMVRLEIFDIQGRRVKAITDHYYLGGYQAVQWDRRDEGGATVKPGVFLYRLVAGSFRAQKKMVLLP